MPYDPTTGTFTRVSNSFSDPVLGTVISPTDANLTFDDYDDGLSEVAAWKVSNSNIIGGTNAGQSLTTSPSNVLLGESAGASLTSGTGENTVIGATAGSHMTTGTQCTLIGAEAGVAITTDVGHTFVGYLAGLSANSGASTWNTFVGHSCGRFVTTGGSSCALGRAAMAYETTGSYITAMGHAAYYKGIRGDGVISVGDSSSGADTTGSANWIGTGLTYYGSVDDVDVAYIGRYTGKSSATARSNATALGNLARLPAKDNVIVLGHGIAAVQSLGSYWDGWARANTTGTVGLTITAADLLAGIVVRSGALAGGVNDTTDTAANIVAAGPGANCEVPCSVERCYANNTTGGFNITIVAGAGVTMSGVGLGAAIAPNTVAKLRIQITNSTPGAEAVSIYRTS